MGSNAVGAGYTLPVFAAVFLGGAVLTGGRGSFIGAMLGALFLALLDNVTPLLNIPDAWQQIIYGVILLVAIAAYASLARIRSTEEAIRRCVPHCHTGSNHRSASGRCRIREDRAVNPTCRTLIDGRTFVEAPRWHEGRFWFSELYTHKVMSANEDGSDLRVEAVVPGQPSGMDWLPDGRLLVTSMRTGC